MKEKEVDINTHLNPQFEIKFEKEKLFFFVVGVHWEHRDEIIYKI